MISGKMQLMHLGYSGPPREHLLLYWKRVHLKEVISVMNHIIFDGDKNHRQLQKCLCEFCHYLHSDQVAFWQNHDFDKLQATWAELLSCCTSL